MLKNDSFLQQNNIIRHQSADPELRAILKLIRSSFAYMDERISPPSSMHRLTLQDVADQCITGEVWSISHPLRACVFFTYKPNVLYIGKLCVEADFRHRGFARLLLDLARMRAEELSLTILELETRIELNEVHSRFYKMGFKKVAEGSHKGYDRPTYFVMRKNLDHSVTGFS